MSQRLKIMTRKDGKSKGVMIRKTNATKNPNTLKAVFQFAYNEHIKRKKANGKSKG